MWSLQLYRVQLVSVVVLLFANSCVATELPAYNPGKLALLIGIDRYKSNSIRQLSGAVNDIRLMREVLIGKFGMPPRTSVCSRTSRLPIEILSIRSKIT